MRCSYFFIITALFFSLAAGGRLEAAQSQPPYKVVVFTHQQTGFPNSDERTELFARNVSRHWPDQRVELRYMPLEYFNRPGQVTRLFTDLADDPLLRGVIISEAPVGSFDGLVRLRALRPELFIFVIDPHEEIQKMAKAATLTLALNHPVRAFTYPTLAQRMEARSLVLLSFPRHMRMSHFARMQRVMSEVTRDLGMILITDDQGPDPLDPAVSRLDLENYLHETMDRYLEQYGPQTAFMSSSTLYSEMLVPLAMQKGGRILPAPQPSLLLGFPQALDLVEEARALFGQWRRLLALEDEKIMSLKPPAEFAVWTYPYPDTVILAVADLAAQAIESQVNIYDLHLIGSVLNKYSPGAKWLVSTHLDYDSDELVPQVFLLMQDSYWFGRGYQGLTRVHVPGRYLRIK